MRFQAPAKINLTLEVRGRRADGFHEIETRIVPVTLCDELEIEPGRGLDFSCSEPELAGHENLAVRAARRFCAEAGIAPDFKIHLGKRIPHGAGLGGGSSDAASVLLALNALCGGKFSRETLLALAGELGSDVPVFILGSAAICTGRGELVEPAAFTEQLPLLLLKPSFGVPTPWAYSRWRDSRELPGIPYGPQTFPWGALVNDLERPVFEKYVVLAAMKRWLIAQPEAAGALLSGSGSTMIALLRDPSGAETLAARAQARFGPLWTCACRTR